MSLDHTRPQSVLRCPQHFRNVHRYSPVSREASYPDHLLCVRLGFHSSESGLRSFGKNETPGEGPNIVRGLAFCAFFHSDDDPFQQFNAGMAEVRAAHLLVKHAGSRNPISRRTNERITRSKEEAIAILTSYRKQIMAAANPQEEFMTLASKYSDCGSYRAGGDLGAFGRGQMQRPFEDAAFALTMDEISGVVDTDSGVHIILRLPVD